MNPKLPRVRPLMSSPVIQTEKANLELMSGKSMLHILKDVTFQVNSGEVTAVVGPSGSGKTSLLMILGGLERATNLPLLAGAPRGGEKLHQPSTRRWAANSSTNPRSAISSKPPSWELEKVACSPVPCTST